MKRVVITMSALPSLLLQILFFHLQFPLLFGIQKILFSFIYCSQFTLDDLTTNIIEKREQQWSLAKGLLGWYIVHWPHIIFTSFIDSLEPTERSTTEIKREKNNKCLFHSGSSIHALSLITLFNICQFFFSSALSPSGINYSIPSYVTHYSKLFPPSMRKANKPK